MTKEKTKKKIQKKGKSKWLGKSRDPRTTSWNKTMKMEKRTRDLKNTG